MAMRRAQTAKVTSPRDKRQNVAFKPETNTHPGNHSTSRSPPSVPGASPERGQRLAMVEASRNRLSIRKSASFPMQQTAPKMFLASCADITRHGRDWNAEFQLAWELEDNTTSQAESRTEALRRVEREFVSQAMVTVKQIVTLDDNGPRELPKFLQCFRVDNIFFRVLPDSRSGRNYVSSLRGVLQSRTRLLTVPLSCMFFYRGMPVLAQALVPMSQQPTRLYGAGSTNDPEVEAEVILMANSLNIQFPDATLEVYEGLDGRFYVTNSNSTLTPLFPDDTIMKKQTMLRMCPNVTDGHDDTLALLENPEVQDAVVRACMDSELRPIAECLKNVGEVLHAYGVNMCLLKQVAQKIASVERFDASTVMHVKKMICIEMIARSIKQEFYVEVQGKRIAYDDEVLSTSLSKQMGEAFASVNLFLSRFLEVVAKKYGVVDEDEDIIRLLTDVRTKFKADIVSRVCALVGVTIEKSGNTQMTWHIFVNARVLPDLTDLRLVRVLAEKYQSIRTQENHRYAFSWPIRWKVACWGGKYDEALDLVHETALAYREREGEASIASLCAKRSVCEVCFATMQRNSIAEGRSLFPGVMSGFEELTCPMTQGRGHIEYGYWLLRVALVYHPDDLVTYRSCVEEAVEHFYHAIAKLPEFLRSEHGSWLHLQPYKGLLQCKQLLPSCSVNTRALVGHSIELSTIGWASDFFMLYLWDLALQLEAEGLYEDAIRVILTAITVSKKKPTISLNLPTLMVDAAYIYRCWNADKYGEHCLTLMREATEKSSEIFGVRSREFAVVMNNKGAVEIELSRLNDARESLKRAGLAFKEAGVLKDDPDYLAYLENIVCLKQRASARPKVLRGFLRRYPFLASRNEDFPFSDIRPLEDNVFVSLAWQRVTASGDATQAKQAEQAMKERVWEILRVLQDGNVLRRFPFLPANIHGVFTASLSLEEDKFFMNLADKLESCTEGSLIRQLQGSIRDYVVKKAERTAQERLYLERLEQSFNETHGDYINLMQPISWQYVVEDERFNKLTDQLQKANEIQVPSSKVNEIREAMNKRVAELVAETFTWREEVSQWLPPSKIGGVAAKDIAHDQHLSDLIRDRRDAAARGATPSELSERDYYITRMLDALWDRAVLTRTSQAVEDEETHRMFPFLSERPHHQRLSSLRLLDDPVIAGIAAKLSKREDPRLQAEMAAVVRTIAARHRDTKELKKWYYDLDSVTSGSISLENVPKKRDDYYVELWQRRNIEQVQYGDGSPQVMGRTHQMDNRLAQLSSLMLKVLANEHRRRQRLEAKYPFVDRRHKGYSIEVLGLEDDETFMKLVEQRNQLIASPDASMEAIERVAQQANNHVAKMAAQRANRQEQFSKQYPFLPALLDGTESSELQLDDNEVFSERAAQRLKLLGSTGAENETRRRRLEGEMENIAVAIAREVNIRKWRTAVESEDLHERFPFLPEEPARGVPLGDLRPVLVPEFRALSNQLDELRRDPMQNAAAIRAKEDELTEIVVKLAEERAAATKTAHADYPFLPMRVLGVPLCDLPLRDDELFAAAATSGLQGKESSLATRAAQMAVYYQLTEAQLADGDDAVLAHHPYLVYTTRKCFPLRHLPLQDDGLFNELLDEYLTLMQQTVINGDAAALLRLQLARRADELALVEITKIGRIRDSFVALHPLSLEDLLHLQDHREFQSFEDGQPVAPASPVRLEEAKQLINDDREARAAKMREVDALRKAYPMLGRDIDTSILEDPVIVQMVDTHQELKSDASHGENDLIKLQEQMAQRVGEFKAQQRTESLTTQTLSPQTPPDDASFTIYAFDDDILDDTYYAQLASHLKDIEDRNDPNDNGVLCRIKAQMEGRKAQIQRYISLQMESEQRAITRELQHYPFLQKKVLGIPITSLHLEDDHDMLQMEQRRQTQIQSGKNVQDIEKDMINRARTVAQGLRAEDVALETALPFLGRSAKGVPLRELSLMADPRFVELVEQHARVGPAGDAAERSQLEQEMRDQAGRMARGTRAARRHAGVRSEDLHERFPFLPEEPARGVPLGDLRPVLVPEFRALSNQLDELRRDPMQNAAAIRAKEDELTEIVVKLAEERAAATKTAHADYPFLPMRVLGVPLCDLPLRDDDTLLQLARRYARQLKHPSGAKDASATEDEISKRVEALARAAKLVDAYRCENTEYVRARNPFLVYEDRKCMLLNEIPLAGDTAYQQLCSARLNALGSAEADAALMEKLEEGLCNRADELALGECAKLQSLLERYPFLVLHSVPGWLKALLRDTEFQQLCARHDELSRDPARNAAELREVEDAMNARGDAIADALRAAELKNATELDRLRVLYPTRPDVTLAIEDDAELDDLAQQRADLEDDVEFNDLDQQQAGLGGDVEFNDLDQQQAGLGGDVEFNDLMRQNSEFKDDAEFKDLTQQRANLKSDAELKDLAQQRTELKDDAEFKDLAQQRAELMGDAAGNADAIAALDSRMARRSIAVALGVEAPPEGATLYPFLPDSILGIPQAALYLWDDPYFQELLARYEEVVPGGEAAAVPLARQLLAQLHGRAAQLAADEAKCRAAAARAEARMEALCPAVDPQALGGAKLHGLGLDADPAFLALLLERDALAADPNANADAIREKDAALLERARTVAQGLRAEDVALETALPFLGRSAKGVPLRELSLMADPRFVELVEQHARVGPAGDAAERSQLEQEMRDQAGRMARGTRAARRHAGVRSEDLHERFPFLPEEPARGVPLGDLRPVLVPEFRALSNQLDELRRDPMQNAAAIRAKEDELTEIVVKLAEERAAATKTAHADYPFLPMRVLGVPLCDLPLRDDDTLLQLARRYARQLKHPSGAKDASATEDEISKRVEALARAAKLVDAYRCENTEYVRARNPFLVYEDRKCMLLNEIPLAGDTAYQQLCSARLNALGSAEADAALMEKLEEGLCNRADKLALGECAKLQSLLERYPFLVLHSVPGWLEALLRDTEFQQLCARHDELSRDPARNAAELREVEDAMNARGDAIADALRAAELKNATELDRLRVLYPTRPDVTLAIEDDAEFKDLAQQRAELMGDAAGNADAIAALDSRMARRSIAVALGVEAPPEGATLYPFLPDSILGIPQAALYLWDDPYFQELLARYEEVVPGGEAAAVPLARQLLAQLHGRAAQLAADEAKCRAAAARAEARMEALCPAVDPQALGGAKLHGLGLDADPAFLALLLERDALAADPNANADAIREKDAALLERARTVAQGLRAEDVALETALPFLGRSAKGVPLRELSLMADPRFVELVEQHARVGPAGDAAERSQLEQEMRDQAGRMARGTRAARRHAGVRSEDLHERFPFLPEEPARGVPLGDLRPVLVPEFRALSNQLDELRRDPMQNAAAIRAKEDELTEIVVKLAEERAAATKTAHADYPFLPMRVLGVPLCDLPLRDDDTLLQLARRYARQLKHPSGAKDASATEDEISKRVEALARAEKLVDAYRCENTEYVRARNPFLVYEDRKCMLLNEIPLAGDTAYQQLCSARLNALGSAEADAALMEKLEEGLCNRADELALGECAKLQSLLERYPFLVLHSVPGWLEALLRDTEFQQLCARHDELSRDPARNAAELREVEDAMNACGDAIADALRAAELKNATELDRLRVLYPTRPNVTLAIEGDAELKRLSEGRSSVVQDTGKNAEDGGMVDLFPGERFSLISGTSEEGAIEFCEESEVIPFTIAFRRKIDRHRRTRFIREGTQDSCEEPPASGDGEEDGAKTKTGVIECSSGIKDDGSGMRQETDNDQKVDLASGLPITEEGRRDGESAEGVANEEVLGEGEKQGAADKGESALQATASGTTMDDTSPGVVPNDEDSASASNALNEKRESMGFTKGEVDSTIGEDELGKKLSTAASLFVEIPPGASETEVAFYIDSVQQRLHILFDELDARESLCRNALQSEETLCSGFIPRHGEKEREKSLDLHQLAEEETQKRAEIISSYHEFVAGLVNDGLVGEGALTQETIEGLDADKRLSIIMPGEEGEYHLTGLQSDFAKIIRDERLARSNIAEMEAEEMNRFKLENEDEEIALEGGPRRAKKQSALFENDESSERENIALEETEELRAIQQQFYEGLSSSREKEAILSLAITKLMEEESEKRQPIYNSEEGFRQTLHETFDVNINLAKRAEEIRHVEEQKIQEKVRERDAQDLIRNVAHSYQVRKRLGSRFYNRKVQEHRNAVESVFRNEFTERKGVADEEKRERNQIEIKSAPLSSLKRMSPQSLGDIEKEEDEVRHQLFDDTMFQIQNLQRAFKKILMKQSLATPSLQQLQEYEDREDGIYNGAEDNISPMSRVKGAVLFEDDDADGEEEDDDDPIESGKYKGYALDHIGVFLLQYERDLRRFKASLEKNRQIVAAEHDLIKKARDHATQEIVHSGTGALWIPTKPLPLSDLVRGPSAQYRRGRIVDARGQRLSSKGPDADGRTVTLSDATVFDGFVKQGCLF